MSGGGGNRTMKRISRRYFLLFFTLSTTLVFNPWAGELTGSLVDMQKDPVCGCVVSLIKIAKSDTAAQGVFKLTNLPRVMPRASGAGERVFIDVFTLAGKKIAHSESMKVPAGKFRTVFPSASARAVYVMKVHSGSFSSSVKLLSVGNERVPEIGRAHV
jgi:hypothetical protein